MNNSQISQTNSKKMRGQALLEFALVAPVLMLIIFGIIEFGRMFFIYSQVNNAAREAAHYGITTEVNGLGEEHYLDCTGIEAVAQSFSFLSPVTVVTAYDDGAVHQAYCGDSSYAHTLGDRIVITTTADFETLVPLVNIPPITFSASVARTILKGLPFDESLPSAPIGCYNLALDPSPYVGGTVIVIDPGTACPADDRFYDDGSVVTYLAVPNSSYSFIEWIDDGAGTNITGTVTMTEDKSVVGVFESPLECHFLNSTVTPSGAAGTIFADTNYNCEENFRDGWLDGTLVRINAIPSSGYSFVDWSGDMNGTANPQDLLFINGDQDVTGNFVADACYTIAVNRIPVVGGDYTYSPPKDCPDGSGWLDGTVVTLDASVNSGYTFNSWDDGTNPITNTTIAMTMNMTTPASIDLTFDSILPCYALSVSPSPNTGGGAVANPAQNCVGGWTDGTLLALYAIPNPGYSFGSWTGPVTDPAITPTGVDMDADKSIVVNFDFTGNDLAIIKSGTVLVQEGGIITYTLRVVNNGSNPATSIIVNDTLPATVSYAGYSSSLGSCAPSGGNVVCFLGTLPAGPSSTEIEIYATAITAGTAVNSALVYAAESDPNPGNNTDSTTTVIKLPIDLEIIKSAPATSVQGEELTYTLVVTNHGPGIATNVIVNDPLPADTQHVSTSSTLCNIDASDNIRCSLGTMNSGDTFATDIVVIPLSSGGGGGTTVITPTLTQDAYIDQENPTDSFSSPLHVHHKDSQSKDRVSLIHFSDLSAVNGTIDSAKLILTASTTPSPIREGDVTVGNITSLWVDGSVTFDNYGGDTLSITGGTWSALTNELTFDVTTMVNNWVNNSISNHGFAIRSVQSGKEWIFDAGGSTAPQLIITTSAPAGSSTLVNEATVAASEGETDTSNNSDDATTTITTGVEFIIAEGATNNRACGEAGDSVIVYGYNWGTGSNDLDVSFEHGEVPATNVSMLAIANYTPSGSPWQETVTLPAIAVDNYHTIRVTHGGVNVTTRFQIPCPSPDLIVSDPVLIGTQPITSHTPISFTVVVTNIGNLAAISEFPVGLYIDPSPAPIAGDTYITETYRTVLGLVGGLSPSSSQTLTMAIDNGLVITGTYDAYAVADSDPSPTGQIAERNETNNISAAVPLTVVENSNLPPATPTPSPATISGTISGLAYIIDAGLITQQYTQVELYDITGGGNVLKDSTETDVNGSFIFSNVQAGGSILYKVTGCIVKDSQPYFYSIQPIILAVDGSSYTVYMELQPVGSCG